MPPIISETDKTTNFEFGRYIHRVHPNKSLLKIWENRERGRMQGLPKFLEYPLLSQEWVKLRDVPDIRLDGYPAIFSNPVPAPVPAKMVPGTGYLSRIVLSPFCAFRASLQHCRRNHY